MKISEDISEHPTIEPALFFVIRRIHPYYTCRYCETITAAPVDPAVINGRMAAQGLLAWVGQIGWISFALHPLADRLAELLRQRQNSADQSLSKAIQAAIFNKMETNSFNHINRLSLF